MRWPRIASGSVPHFLQNGQVTGIRITHLLDDLLRNLCRADTRYPWIRSGRRFLTGGSRKFSIADLKRDHVRRWVGGLEEWLGQSASGWRECSWRCPTGDLGEDSQPWRARTDAEVWG